MTSETAGIRLVVAGNNCFGKSSDAFSALDAAMLTPFVNAWNGPVEILSLDTQTDRKRAFRLPTNASARPIAGRGIAQGAPRLLATPLLAYRMGRSLLHGRVIAYARVPSPMGWLMLFMAFVLRKPIIASIHGMPRWHGRQNARGHGRYSDKLVRGATGRLMNRCDVLFSTHLDGPAAFGSDMPATLFRSTVLDAVPKRLPDEPKFDRSISLGIFGRLSPEKNPLHAIAVSSMLRERGYTVALHVVGSGPLAAEFDSFASTAGVDVNRYGWVDGQESLLEIMRRAHFALIPSFTEGSPKVLVESMAVGVPALILPHNEAVLTMASGGAALIVDDLDTDRWCDVIERYWEREAYTRLQRRGRARAADYTVPALVDHIRRALGPLALNG